jgi:hypothetical protein
MTTKKLIRANKGSPIPEFYEELIRVRIAEVTHRSGLPTARNLRGALIMFLETCGKNPSDRIGVELTSGFAEALRKHEKRLYQEGLAAGKPERTLRQHLSSQKSRVRNWQNVMSLLLEKAGMPSFFHEQLLQFFEQDKISMTELSRRTGVPQRTLHSWLRAHLMPARRSISYIRALERYYKAPPETLVDKLRYARPTEGHNGYMATARCQTSFGQALSHLTQLRYLLKPFPPNVQAEWQALKKYKTAPLQRIRNEPARNGRWREDDETRPGSAHRLHVLLQSFFGFLALPQHASVRSIEQIDRMSLSKQQDGPHNRDWAIKAMQGKGVDQNALSLALFSDAELVLEYVEFMRHRTGVYNNGTITAITSAMSLLREGTGYLRQQPQFRHNLPVPIVTEDGWDKWCADNFRLLAQAYRDIINGTDFMMARDPFEPIASILSRNVPATALFDLAKAIERDKPTPGNTHRAHAQHMRDYLLVRMLTFYPLRIKHYSDMKLGENLYQGEDGGWRLRFPARTFKNDRGASRRDYDVQVDPSLWPVIIEYLHLHRPHLYGGADLGGYVFLKGTHPPELYKSTKPRRIDQKGFLRILHRLTSRHLGLLFGPHAIRHIIATTILKQRPMDWRTAADALHDTEETVRQRYAHLSIAKGVAEVNKLMSGLFNKHAQEMV